jgi:hypothetical protein
MLNIFVSTNFNFHMFMMNTADACKTYDHLWEYTLLALPDEKLDGAIREEKEFFDGLYDGLTTLRKGPHIRVAAFLAKEAMEETLVRWIRNICQIQETFTVTLNNYSGFPSHTIYLRVQDPTPFIQLASRLRIIDSFVQSNDCPPVQLTAKPFLSIAGGLSESIYTEAIRLFAQKTFHANFTLEKLVLVKRSWEGERDELVERFHLAPAFLS